TDFGLALRHGDLRLTKEGAFVGTIYYVAPEIAMGVAFDHRADLYAAGAMLYELLTGSPPFSGDNPVVIISNVLNTPAPSPRLINADIPPAIEKVILRLLAKDPAARYASAEDILAVLPVPDDAPDSDLDSGESTADDMVAEAPDFRQGQDS